MGKGRGSTQTKQQVTDYRMSLHYGICSGPTVLREILIDDKVVWSGRMDSPGWININQPTLFGGPTKEGGCVGWAYFMPGKQDQIMPNSLAARFGLTSETCPAFRGLSTIFFVGDPVLPGGFLWTSNSPIIRGVKFKVERTPLGLDPAYAMIGNALTATFNNHQVTIGSASGNLTDGVAKPIGPHTVMLTTATDGTRTIGLDGTDLIVNPYILDNQDNQTPGYTITLNGSTATLPDVGTVTIGGATVSVTATVITYTVGADANVNANAIHMIYECLTNTQWGMAAPSYLIDTANFTSVAKKIFAEGFALSIKWTQQDTVETYVSEILDHIVATLFVNPRTGLLDIMLLRDDYDFDSLRQLNPHNSSVKKFKRKLYGETINEVNVTWTNPENEKSETVTAQDDANIAIQGTPVSTSRNYYGIRSADLAARVAARDSRSASAPLATLEVEVDRSGWDLLPGSVLRCNYPKLKLNDVVCRVVKIAYGKAGDPKIKVSLLQDIFSLSHVAPIAPPSTANTSTNVAPTAMQFAQLITLPYFITNKEVGDLEYPNVLAGMLAYQPGGATVAYDLFTRRPLANGDMQWTSVGTKTILGRSTLLTPAYAEATSLINGLPLTGEARGPVKSGLVAFGSGGEGDMEIALLQALDGNTWTVKRGVLDTTPRFWEVGTPVWFLPPNGTIADALDQRAVGETPTYRAITRTSRGVLDIAAASDVSATMTARPHAPLRPANVKINAQGFGDVDATSAVSLAITWETRNRLTEDTQIMPWDGGSVTPEYLQMSIVTVFRENGQLMTYWRGMYSETSLTIPIAAVQQEHSIFIRVSSERSGITSLQSHGMWVRNIPQVANPSPPPAPSDGSAPPAPPPPPSDPDPDPVPGLGGTQYGKPGGFNDPGSWEQFV